MFFFIDTSLRGSTRFAMIPAGTKGEIVERTYEGRRDFVASAADFFGKRVGRIRGIIVVAGPGSFSAIRSGVLFANLMSRMLEVPLYQVQISNNPQPPTPNPQPLSLKEIRSQIASGHLKPVPYVAPIYDAEPNITVKS